MPQGQAKGSFVQVGTDLNPVKNLFGNLVRRVYAGGRQYATVAELKASIQQEWNNLDVTMLKKLAESLPARLFQVGARQGASTGY